MRQHACNQKLLHFNSVRNFSMFVLLSLITGCLFDTWLSYKAYDILAKMTVILLWMHIGLNYL